MTNSVNGTTWVGSWTTGMEISPHRGDKPEPAPRQLIATRAVQTKAGWVGQVIIDAEIIWETEPWAEEGDESPADAAIREANTYVVDRIKRLFAPESDPEDGGRL